MQDGESNQSRVRQAPAGTRKTVSIRDVADAAGVSVATVSRALSADSAIQIKPETRAHVLEASAELGYRPNDLARALLQQRTSVLGLIVPDILNPYYPGMVRGVEDVASAAGYRMVLCNTDRDPERINGYLETLVKSRVDGVLIAGGAADRAIDVALLDQYHASVVVVGRHDLACPSVQIDNVASAEAITTHLLGLGHRRISLVGGPESSRTMRDRAQGYRRALTARKVPVRQELVRGGDLDEESGYDNARVLAQLAEPPTAIVAVNDRVAVGVLAALHDDGIRVPEDVSVTGFDDVSFSPYLRPKLTTVSVPTYDIGHTAATLLLGQLTGVQGESQRQPNDHVTKLSAELVIRDSTGPPRRRTRR